MYAFTDLGWRRLEDDGGTGGDRKPGFVWHTDPGCILLPHGTRICFYRCDKVQCVRDEVCGLHLP